MAQKERRKGLTEVGEAPKLDQTVQVFVEASARLERIISDAGMPEVAQGGESPLAPPTPVEPKDQKPH